MMSRHVQTTLGKISSLITSGSRGWADYYSETGALFLRMTNLPKDGIRILLDDNKFVSLPSSSSEGQRTKVQPNDILISITAELGKIGFINDDLGEAYVNQHVALVRITSPDVHHKFIAYYLAAAPQRKLWQCLNDAGAKAGLNLQTISKFPVTLPPCPEQAAIANLLTTCDDAIDKAERLIAAKEKQKKAVMQSLLTSKLRLKGFSENWSEFHLGDLFKERSERASDHLPLLSITREEGVIPRSEDRKDTSSEDKSNYLRICPGDIGYNTMRMWQGVSGLSSLEGIVSPAYTICTPKKGVDGEFMAYLFKLPRVVNLFYRYSQGLTSDTWNLKYKHFREIKVTIPEINEQKAIAKVLKAYDEEIRLLKQQLDALRRQKRGLMQKLLTGVWRVKTSKEVV